MRSRDRVDAAVNERLYPPCRDGDRRGLLDNAFPEPGHEAPGLQRRVIDESAVVRPQVERHFAAQDSVAHRVAGIERRDGLRLAVCCKYRDSQRRDRQQRPDARYLSVLIISCAPHENEVEVRCVGFQRHYSFAFAAGLR